MLVGGISGRSLQPFASQVGDRMSKKKKKNIGFLFLTGDKTNQVHMEGYQVSNQCMALVRDNCLLPTKDAPELGYVRESSDKQYVPDVYYKVSVFLFQTRQFNDISVECQTVKFNNSNIWRLGYVLGVFSRQTSLRTIITPFCI